MAMSQTHPPAIRKECPPGLCECDRERLLDDPAGDKRILLLTATEEKKLVERIENVSSYADLQHVTELMRRQLGIVLQIIPSVRGVRTLRGLTIKLEDQLGLCRKTRQAVPAAVRRCLERNPEIVYAILDAHDLLGRRA